MTLFFGICFILSLPDEGKLHCDQTPLSSNSLQSVFTFFFLYFIFDRKISRENVKKKMVWSKMGFFVLVLLLLHIGKKINYF